MELQSVITVFIGKIIYMFCEFFWLVTRVSYTKQLTGERSLVAYDNQLSSVSQTSRFCQSRTKCGDIIEKVLEKSVHGVCRLCRGWQKLESVQGEGCLHEEN
jgi:hypothetical protein